MQDHEEHVAGDNPELSQKLGIFDLSRNAFRVRVPYKDQVVYCEVYLHPDGSKEIHWMCPRCGGSGKGYMSRIATPAKQIEFDPRRKLEAGGELNVEPFQCPWDLGDAQAGGYRKAEFGIGFCKLTIAIDNSVAKDA